MTQQMDCSCTYEQIAPSGSQQQAMGMTRRGADWAAACLGGNDFLRNQLPAFLAHGSVLCVIDAGWPGISEEEVEVQLA